MAETEEWRLCVDWLVRCQIIQADHRVTLASSQVFDLAQVLRDGVLICHLLNGLHVGAIDLKDFSQRPQMSQFLCLKNIRAFLNTCRKVFGLEGVLFDPYDLFEVRDFGKVIKTLSLLSKSPKAKASGIAPFPPNNFVSRQHSDYYNTLEDLATGFRECDPTYVRLPEIAESRDFEDDDVYYDHVTADADEDDIYEDLCAVRRQAALAGEPRSKRDFCIKELEETEKNYVEALDMIITHFVRPLKSCTSADDHKVIFLSIETLQGVHHSFLVELQKATGSVHVKAMHKPSIPDCFIQWKEQFLIYGDFCSNLPRAQERVDDLCNRSEAIREKINECQKKANEGKFRLRDLLSVPMQRVLKYHLLLTELIKQTDREHPDRIALDRALEEMKDLSLYVNEVKRDNEALQLINEIQNSITDLQMPDNTSLKDYGKLLKDGELKIKSHDDNRARNRYIFLFDKVMLMCKSRGETYGYKNALILSQYRVEQMARPTGDRAWSFAFLLVEKNSQSAYTIQAKTDDMKKKWIDAIEMAHDNTAPKGAREGSHEFIMFSFVEPTICDVCRKLLRGVFYQGYKCQSTNMAVHKECIMKAKNLLGPPTRPERVTFPQPSRPRNREVISHVKARAPNDGSMGPQHNRSVLKFQEGAVIQLLNKDDPNWWEGRLNGIEGFFPSALVEEKTRPLLRRPSYTAPLPGALSQQVPPVAHRTPSASSITSNMSSPSPSPFSPNYINNNNNSHQANDMTAFPWFVGEMRRDVATVRLEPTIDSTFLVRESCNPQCKGEYALSIKFGSTVKHIRVFRSPDRMFFLADCKMFRSVPELVQYYRENTLQNSFPELQTTLMYPFRDAAAAAAAQPKPAAAQGISMCTVQYDYTANQLNQLTLEVGDRVTIISKAGGERGWWKGSLNGKIGYFPSAYVEED